MSEILKITDLWGGYQYKVDILRGVSMEVHLGEAVGIIGLNGSGKSTLGKAIMNMLPYRRGSIIFEGDDVAGLMTHELARRGLAIMQQGGRVFPALSVWDNLQLAAKGSFVQFSTHNSQLIDAIPLLQCPKFKLQYMMADKLSGGEKHQLSLVMTLATNPRLVVLDEPSAGLSPIDMRLFYSVLDVIRKRSKIAIVLIEQNVLKAVEFCDYLYEFRYGLANRIKKVL